MSAVNQQPGRVSPGVPDLEIAPESSADAPLNRRLERARQVLLASLGVLALIIAWLLYEDGIGLADVALATALVALALALYVMAATSAALTRNRFEREASIRRIVTGLSRSASPQSVVDTVISDLRTATDADHVVVARVREDETVEVTLVAAQADAPPSRTTLRPELDVHGAVPGEGADEGEGEAVGASDEAADAAEEIARRVRAEYKLPHTLATPLVAERRFLGALLLARRGREAWSDGDRRLLTWAANEVARAFERTYALEAAERGAKIDALTGLPNRRYFNEALAMIESPRRRANDSIGILMIDIDHFKILNDRFGHATGDQVLRAVSTAIARAVRDEDTPARYGGEEFAVLLRQAEAEQALEVGERIRRAVVKLHPASLGISEPVTVSVGVAVSGPDGPPVRRLVERADQALYKAKRQGRDRVIAV
ncbi:MAG: sensor domain-containing diguanylate cyclase [Chloroflexota bacterium]